MGHPLDVPEKSEDPPWEQCNRVHVQEYMEVKAKRIQSEMLSRSA